MTSLPQMVLQKLPQKLPQKSTGFTLVEVLVAVTILAFTIPALMTLMATQTDGAAVLRNKTIANWVAENEATKLRLQQRLSGNLLNREQRNQVEMSGTNWYTAVDIENTVEGALVQYKIRVGLSEEDSLITLETYLDN